jgi:hypothetical protein
MKPCLITFQSSAQMLNRVPDFTMLFLPQWADNGSWTLGKSLVSDAKGNRNSGSVPSPLERVPESVTSPSPRPIVPPCVISSMLQSRSARQSFIRLGCGPSITPIITVSSCEIPMVITSRQSATNRSSERLEIDRSPNLATEYWTGESVIVAELDKVKRSLG